MLFEVNPQGTRDIGVVLVANQGREVVVAMLPFAAIKDNRTGPIGR